MPSYPSLSIRARITTWYVALVTLSLVLFGGFMYIRLRDSLLSEIDLNLKSAAAQAHANLEADDGMLLLGGQSIEYVGRVAAAGDTSFALTDGTTFAITDDTDLVVIPIVGMMVEVDAQQTAAGLVALEVDEAETGATQTPNAPPVTPAIVSGRENGLTLRTVGTDGLVWDLIGEGDEVPFEIAFGHDFTTATSEDGGAWRIHTAALTSPLGTHVGWLQAARPLDSMQSTLVEFRTQLLWGIPLAAVLAAIGGMILADRGLRPIVRIKRTAQSIDAGKLDQRIGYQGPNDEVGQLANTFDSMLDRLADSFERERRFAADASHELRTPLAAMKGRVDVALSAARTTGEYEQALRAIDAEIARLMRLTEQLLFLTRLDRSGGATSFETIDLTALIEAVLDQMRPVAQAKNQSLTSSIGSSLTVNCSPDQIIRVLLNLTDNASKYTPVGGNIHVSAFSENGLTRISVADSGSGIAESHLHHLFERFYRVDESRSRGGGTGLGLAIANEIVTLHGGRIDVTSIPQRGSIFTVTLPAA